MFNSLFAEYTVQERPVTFINHLKSHILFSGDDLHLSCNISLASVSGIQFLWRCNGQDVENNDRTSISISAYTNERITIQLDIENVSISEEGGYECLVLDGLTEDGNAAFITISNTAQIIVQGTWASEDSTRMHSQSLL